MYSFLGGLDSFFGAGNAVEGVVNSLLTGGIMINDILMTEKIATEELLQVLLRTYSNKIKNDGN